HIFRVALPLLRPTRYLTHAHAYRYHVAPLLLAHLRTDPRAAATYALSLHDALPIFAGFWPQPIQVIGIAVGTLCTVGNPDHLDRDRTSTRLNSSHGSISYAVFCLKKNSVHGGIVIAHTTTGRSDITDRPAAGNAM